MDLNDFAVEFQSYLDSMEQARAKKQHHDYRRSLLHSPELSGLMKGNIRKNEIFAIPKL